MTTERSEAFEAQVARVRESGILGRSHGLSRLFDYLADPGRRGQAQREADIAHEVFGRETDMAGDASVRVYVHRLRRKLETFYEKSGAGESHRLVIPVGDYRLEVVDAAATAPKAETRRPRPPWIWPALAARRSCWRPTSPAGLSWPTRPALPGNWPIWPRHRSGRRSVATGRSSSWSATTTSSATPTMVRNPGG